MLDPITLLQYMSNGIILYLLVLFPYDYIKVKHFRHLKQFCGLALVATMGLSIYYLLGAHQPNKGLAVGFFFLVEIVWFFIVLRRDLKRETLFTKIHNSPFLFLLCYGFSDIPLEKMQQAEEICNRLLPEVPKKYWLTWMFIEYRGNRIEMKIIFWNKYEWKQYKEVADTKDFVVEDRNGRVTTEATYELG